MSESMIRVLEERAERFGSGAPLSPKPHHNPARRQAASYVSPSRRQTSSPPRTSKTAQDPARETTTSSGSASSRLAQEKVTFRINQPQRVDAPRDFNTPKRIDHFHNPDPEERGSAQEEEKGKSIRIPGTTVSKIKDFQMLASACRRAGRVREEGAALYNIGVLYDNFGEMKKANECYTQFLSVCQNGNDVKGEALALNSLGVNFFKMKNISEAIRCHQAHLEVADVPGKFVGHTNIGLCFSAMNEDEKAALNHREALRYAIVMASLAGESLACGNLGMIAVRKGDTATAKACMERHLKLSGALHDKKAQADAYEHLGRIANGSGSFEDASQYFELARDAAKKSQDNPTATSAKCQVGMAIANIHFDDYLSQVAQQLVKAEP